MPKFTLAQIGKLIEAGYSLDDILTVENPVETVDNPAPAPAQTEPQNPAPAPVQNPAPADPNAALIAAIDGLTNLIKTSNIHSAAFPAPATQNDPAAILANIINPPAKNK